MTLRSIAEVCEVTLVTGSGFDHESPPDLLIEVPHGATRAREYDAIRRKLSGPYPDRLREFFFVNTDAGAPECALETARQLTADAALGVLVLRSLIPRTFIDCNREVGTGPRAAMRDGLTPGLPGYIAHGDDVETLRALHDEYQALARGAYDQVCGHGGRALILHTYAPRSVQIESIDERIVENLRRAYKPGVYETWDKRPDVDIISETENGIRLAPADLVAAIREAFAEIGIRVAENATYRLSPETTGYRHSARYPGKVLCMEIDRGLLADPFTPFEEMKIGRSSVRAAGTHCSGTSGTRSGAS